MNDKIIPCEAKIQIGDYLLTEGQSIAVRVAVTNFLMELSDADFKRDLGPIGDAYELRLKEVLKVMVEHGGLR